MDVRSLRRKRIIIILVTLVLVVGVVGVVYVVQKKQSKLRIAALRADGMAAFEAEDYALTLEKLGPYVETNAVDADAWYAFARANAMTPSEDGRTLGEAIRALRHVVNTLKADNLDAAHDLLELEVLIEADDRALSLTARILEEHSDDEAALRARVLLLARLDRQKEAWELASKLREQRPGDLEIQLAVMQLRFTLGHPASDIVADARALVDAHPDDPRYELLLGTALGLSGQEEQGIAYLRTAATKPMPEDVPLAVVVRLLDQTSQFDAALHLLVEQVTPDSDPLLVTEKVNRCFEAGQYDQVRATLAGRDLTDPSTEVQIAAIGAMTAIQGENSEQAKQIAAALHTRKNNPQAGAWADVLDHLVAHGMEPDAESVPLLREAVKRAPGSAYLYVLLGDALADSNESAQAADAWRQGAALRTVWDAPLRQLARYYLASGQYEQAVNHAEAAYLRRPGNIDNALVYMQVRAAGVQPGDDVALGELLTQLDEIDAAVGNTTRTLLLRAETLAQLGQVDALGRLLSLVAEQQPELSRGVLARLIELSQRYELDTTTALAAMTDAAGDPEAVLAEAQRLISTGRADEAIAYIDDHRADGPAWDLVRAQVLDAAEYDGAADVWKELTKRYPDDARIQVAALRSAALANDSAAAALLVDRLRKIGGEEGTVWRVEQARWRLRSGGDPEAALELLRAAIAKDPSDLDARVLSASAYQRSGRTPLAVRELQTAIGQRPDVLSLRLDLAELYQQMRSYDAASEQLNQVALNRAASPALLRRTALMMAQQGADLRAIAVLEELMQRSGDSGAVDNLLLASLYRRNGMTEKAEAACQRLLAEPTPSGVLFVAGFYAMNQRGDEARRVLAMLDDMEAPADEIATTRASYFARFGSPDEALPHYRAAVDAAPDNRDHWRRLVSFELTIGEDKAALADAARAAKALDDAGSLDTLVEHDKLVERFASTDRWRPLVISIVSEPAGRDVALQALKLLDKASDDPAAQAKALQSFVLSHGEHLPLQLAQVRALMDAGDASQAGELATRAMYTHPTSVDAAWMAAEALSTQQRWTDALGAASQWRQRSAGQSMNADLIIAEAKLQLNDVQAALREITPHLKAAMEDPRHYPAVIYSYSRILVAEGRAAEARKVLRPLLEVDASWRQLCIRLAALGVSDPVEAATWLNELEPFVPPDAVEEHESLAQAWWSLFLRTNSAAHRANALTWVDRVIAQTDADSESWLLKGIISEISGQLDTAEQAYRKSLELDAKQTSAANNLAMVILHRNGDLDEATTLAKSAVDLQPNMPDYLDTLAQVHAKAGRYDPAIDAMRRAIDVDPGRAIWQWNLLDLYEAAGKENEAESLRNQLRLEYPRGRPDESASAL